MKTKIEFAVLALTISVTARAQNYGEMPAPPQSQPIALIGATIHPVSAAPIANGTIVFDQGKITAMAAAATIPAGARRIELAGKHIYPGLIDAHTSLGLTEIGAMRATRDYSETGTINPNVRAEAAINPDSELLPVARANGIALALSVPSGGVISGTSALIRMDGWTWEELTYKAPVAMHLRWPRMTVARAWWVTQSEEDQRKQMKENQQKLKEAFTTARAYKQAKQAETAKGSVYHDTDSRWEAMMPVFDRQLPVFVTANDLSQIQAAVHWAEEENLRIVIVGGDDSWRAATLLKEKSIPVIFGPVHSLPGRRWEAYDTPFSTPAKLHEAGVQFCIADFDESNVRNLPYQAATAAAYGLPKETALRAITLSAAEILGVADRVGSLEIGKDATLIVTTGDPLEITTQVEQLYLEGRQIDLNDKQKALYRKYSEKYRRLHDMSNGHAGRLDGSN